PSERKNGGQPRKLDGRCDSALVSVDGQYGFCSGLRFAQYGHLIQTAPPRALQTLMRLTALLRAVLRSEGEFTTLGRELEVVESYLDIERARFEHRLTVRIDVPDALRSIRVPSLLLQPIVENAIKHGIAPRPDGG